MGHSASLTSCGPGRSATRAPDRAALAVEVHSHAANVLGAWAELEGLAAASLYQTRAFLLPWLETRGAALAITPFFILVRSEAGQAVALFCLGLHVRGPFRIASFLGAKDSNFNLGLLRPGFEPGKAEICDIFRRAAQTVPNGPDLYALFNMPLAWEGRANPLAALQHQESPSFAYMTALADDPALIDAKLSKDMAKKLRKKEKRLADRGALVYGVACDGVESAAAIDAFFRQKIARCTAQGIVTDFATPPMRAFVEMLAAAGRLELYTLALEGRVLAVYGGGVHRGRFSAMFNSFDADPAIAASSPGDLLLKSLIAQQAAAGRASFDLGIGEARYKMSFCDETIVLIDAVLPVGIKGRLLAFLLASRQKLKRAIKQNPRLFAWIRRFQRTHRR